MKLKGSKRKGVQACDNCGRDFDAGGSTGWDCPYCGADNRAGVEAAMHGARVAANRYAGGYGRRREAQP